MLNNAMAAVEYRDIAAVNRVIAAGADLEQRDENGSTPLIAATSSDQFLIAERLVAGGADIWACDAFGTTAGRMIERSRTPAMTDEGQARERLAQVLRQRGFPFPAPEGRKVLAMVASGEWAHLQQADPAGPGRGP